MSSRQGQHAVQETNLRHVVLHVEHLTNRQRAEQETSQQRVEQHVEHPINKQKFQERRSGSHEPVFFISMAHYR